MASAMASAFQCQAAALANLRDDTSSASTYSEESISMPILGKPNTVCAARNHLGAMSSSLTCRSTRLRLPLEAWRRPASSCRCNSTATTVVATTQELAPEVQEELKRALAKEAIKLVKSGMVVGLGTGSTIALAIEELGKLVSSGKVKNVSVVTAAYQASVLARQWGLKALSLSDVSRIDICFDGADEVDSQLNLIKGGGAAQTMEKVVAAMSTKVVVLVDQTKVVGQLGTTFPVPVEVLQPAITPVLRSLVNVGGVPEIRSALRKDGPVITDLGNMVVDVRFPDGITDPVELEKKLDSIPGVLENGIFTRIVTQVLVGAHINGKVVVLDLAEFLQSLSEPASSASSA